MVGGEPSRCTAPLGRRPGRAWWSGGVLLPVFLALTGVARGAAEQSEPGPRTFPLPKGGPPSEMLSPLPAPVGVEHEAREPDSDSDADSGVFSRHPRLAALLICPWRHAPLPGHPIRQESWLQRPFSATWFLGMVRGSTLIDDWIDTESGIFGGVRVGWDLNHYWGTEMRFGFGAPELHDSPRAIEYQVYKDIQAGYPDDHPWRRRFDSGRQATLFLWDLDLLYYPWGDTPLRPYFLLGLGASHLSFDDRLGQTYDKTQLEMPLGVGLKLRCNNALALRFECLDNVAIGSNGIRTLHQLSVVGAAEFRFGGPKKLYWPWTPSRGFW